MTDAAERLTADGAGLLQSVMLGSQDVHRVRGRRLPRSVARQALAATAQKTSKAWLVN